MLLGALKYLQFTQAYTNKQKERNPENYAPLFDLHPSDGQLKMRRFMFS